MSLKADKHENYNKHRGYLYLDIFFMNLFSCPFPDKVRSIPKTEDVINRLLFGLVGFLK